MVRVHGRLVGVAVNATQAARAGKRPAQCVRAGPVSPSDPPHDIGRSPPHARAHRHILHPLAAHLRRTAPGQPGHARRRLGPCCAIAQLHAPRAPAWRWRPQGAHLAPLRHPQASRHERHITVQRKAVGRRRRIAPVRRPQPGDDANIRHRLPRQTAALHESVRPPLAAIVGHRRQPRIAVPPLQRAEVLRRPFHRFGGVVAVLQPPQRGSVRHELRNSLRPGGAERIGIKSAFLPQQPCKEPGIEHVATARSGDVLAGVERRMGRPDTGHRAQRAGRTQGAGPRRPRGPRAPEGQRGASPLPRRAPRRLLVQLMHR